VIAPASRFGTVSRARCSASAERAAMHRKYATLVALPTFPNRSPDSAAYHFATLCLRVLRCSRNSGEKSK